MLSGSVAFCFGSKQYGVAKDSVGLSIVGFSSKSWLQSLTVSRLILCGYFVCMSPAVEIQENSIFNSYKF